MAACHRSVPAGARAARWARWWRAASRPRWCAAWLVADRRTRSAGGSAAVAGTGRGAWWRWRAAPCSWRTASARRRDHRRRSVGAAIELTTTSRGGGAGCRARRSVRGGGPSTSMENCRHTSAICAGSISSGSGRAGAIGRVAECGHKPFESRGRGDREYSRRLRADLEGVGQARGSQTRPPSPCTASTSPHESHSSPVRMLNSSSSEA